MARPCKSANLLTEYSQTKEEIAKRAAVEASLRGEPNRLEPPGHLSDAQKEIFENIVRMFEASEVLGAPDTYLVAQCAIAIDRLWKLDALVNTYLAMLYDKDIITARNAYSKDFFRCCNELSLSPQSRAKVGNMNLQHEKDKKDPLLTVLNGGVAK